MSFDIEVLGTKRHMNDINATMGIVGLTYYNYVLYYRKNLFNIYREKLRNISGIKLIDGGVNTYWLATVLVERRDDFAKLLYEHGIETNIVQVRNDSYKIFGGKVSLPVLDKIEDKYISLPIGTHVTEEGVNYICSIIAKGW
jgi:dTDP-4-amino-4,6-dideoxygalactose transaminase